MLSEVLQKNGYEVVQARNGRECLSAIRRCRPDVVITDLLMPETEGLELIRQLKREFAGIRIIAISGVSNAEFLLIARKFGAVRTLTKPFNMNDFLSAVQETMGQPEAV